MKRILVCLLLALPAGCASNPYPPGSVQGICERQAANDPEVTRLTEQAMVTGGPGPYQRNAIKLAKYQALQRCLLSKGGAPAGGVEPVIRQ